MNLHDIWGVPVLYALSMISVWFTVLIANSAADDRAVTAWTAKTAVPGVETFQHRLWNSRKLV